jgi:hypothetical protein
VIIEDELPVMSLQRLIVDLGRYPQNLVRIAFSGTHVTRFDVAELSIGEPEAHSHLSENVFLVRMEHAVRHRDVEETFKHVLQELAVILQQRCKLLGISFVADDVLLGEVGRCVTRSPSRPRAP